ncbi:MAG TPA: prepilin-type N-terminal cleavage/methylation domain-containing protein, partial [Clostridiales bacterium]|nr:prepilin-type N-terminal cleavage/methylation domain-containing protein [Clostridiales bacterium]
MKRNHSYKKAFTIVELIIVIAVIGILAAILIPTFSNMIARANAKAALADARSTLTSYLSENLSIIDGEIAASIVIFVYKAKAYYVFGYSNTGPDMGKLMQSGGNPYHYDDLAALIEDYNCTDDSIIGTPEEEQYAFYLRTEPSGTGTVKGVKSTKSMDDINNTYVNITDKIGDVPDTSEVFDGFLIGMIVDANQINPGGSGTHPGDNPGGGKPKLIVTFDPGVDDGSVTGMPDPLQIEVEKNVPFELPAAPTREGYDFAGWSAPEIGGVVGPTQFVSVSSSCTITATWEEKVEITITFDPAGGTFEPAEGYSFTGNTIKVFTSDNLTNLILYSRATRANKNFLGWLDEESSILYDDSYTGSIHLVKNTTLKAQWEDILYSLTYDLNGGTGMGTNGGSYPIGTEIVLTQAPTLEGKIFGGWEWEGFTYYKDGTFTMPGYDVTLVAQWLDSYTVTYNAGEGTGTPPTQEPVLPDTEITIEPATGLSRTVDGEEWVFAGWVCNVDGQTYQPGEKYTVVANTTFTANFVPPVYYVTYEGENAPTDTKGYAEDATVTVLNVTAPRDGYTFLGWYAAQNGQMYQPDDTFKMPKGGITLEAQW